jgi:hypothetical protein
VRSRPDREPVSGCDVVRAIPHLPAGKQRQLCAIVGIIRDMAEVERVILYGSHARGDWVDDPANGYLSDFDVAVLVGSPALAVDEALWADCQERARDAAGDTPVSLIVHTVDDVRQQLERGGSFFRDVMAEGVALYDAGRVAITVPDVTPAMHHALAQDAFERYFEHATQLYLSFERNLAHGSLAIAAFELHQVAETICKAVLVVFTAYLPKMHDLDELGRRCIRPVRVWGRSCRRMRRTASTSEGCCALRMWTRATASRSRSRARSSMRSRGTFAPFRRAPGGLASSSSQSYPTRKAGMKIGSRAEGLHARGISVPLRDSRHTDSTSSRRARTCTARISRSCSVMV